MKWFNQICFHVLVLASVTTVGISNSVAQPTTSASGEKTELMWFGQAGFRIKTPGGKAVVIDPWLTGGPKTPAPYKTDISSVGRSDTNQIWF